MDAKQFGKLLELMNKGKREEEEEKTILKSRAEIRAHTGKTFYARWMEDRDGREKL